MKCSDNVLTDCAEAFLNCQMSWGGEEDWSFMFCFVLIVVGEHMKWFWGAGATFHTVNHVYFSAEKVQFALHLFPKKTIMFCGLHTWTTITFTTRIRSCADLFSSSSIYCKEVFSYTTITVYFGSFFFSSLGLWIFTPTHSTTYVYAKQPIIFMLN